MSELPTPCPTCEQLRRERDKAERFNCRLANERDALTDIHDALLYQYKVLPIEVWALAMEELDGPTG